MRPDHAIRPNAQRCAARRGALALRMPSSTRAGGGAGSNGTSRPRCRSDDTQSAVGVQLQRSPPRFWSPHAKASSCGAHRNMARQPPLVVIHRAAPWLSGWQL
jgi:hypothetical protein